MEEKLSRYFNLKFRLDHLFRDLPALKIEYQVRVCRLLPK